MVQQEQEIMQSGEEREQETEGSIYGDYRLRLEEVRRHLVAQVQRAREKMLLEKGMDPVEHCLSRIKSEESMREKCRRKGLPETTESALEKINDAVGVRVVCSFLSDVYVIRDYLASVPDIEVLEEKDYIRHAKPNGYRSYHMILLVGGSIRAEIQLRTISQDTWAALEHQLKYKKQAGPSDKLIVEELKRCADELASTDVSMQTIRDLIQEQNDAVQKNAPGV
jgi:putative GTP pyrophosphokinase